MTRAAKLHWIRADDPPDAFPDPALALDSPEGLLAAGGDLSPERLLCAYAAGIFPWYEGQPILWWSPDPRAILRFDELKVSAACASDCDRAASGSRSITASPTSFGAARPRAMPARIPGSPTRCIAPMWRCTLLGFAHSVETWLDEELVGGLYGVAIGGVFFGESMFSRASDASKVALVRLVEQLRQRQFRFIDCQLPSAHLESLGSRTVPRRTFLRWLRKATCIGGAGRRIMAPLAGRAECAARLTRCKNGGLRQECRHFRNTPRW
jgi:leucyl/phenylalanyl-tRNA--protein transferase